jgi:excisionase family DNA binding protein
MSPQMIDPDDDLLTPREVAELFGVRTTTIARWARDGRLDPIRTPGGHRRYSRANVQAVLAAEDTGPERTPEEKRMAEDAARLYDQGWSIRQVADRFGCGYTTMRRILRKQVTLRSR